MLHQGTLFSTSRSLAFHTERLLFLFLSLEVNSQRLAGAGWIPDHHLHTCIPHSLTLQYMRIYNCTTGTCPVPLVGHFCLVRSDLSAFTPPGPRARATARARGTITLVRLLLVVVVLDLSRPQEPAGSIPSSGTGLSSTPSLLPRSRLKFSCQACSRRSGSA